MRIGGSLSALGVVCVIALNLWEAHKHLGTDANRLRWNVVAKSDLPLGARLDESKVQLGLAHLPEQTDAFVSAVSSVLGKYTTEELKEGRRVVSAGLRSAPIFMVIPVTVLVPVSVRTEYAEGLEPGMHISFAGFGKSESAGEDNAEKGGISEANQSNTGSKSSSRKYKKINEGAQPKVKTEIAPLSTTLRAVVPSQDKKSALLVVEVTAAQRQRAHELTKKELVPIILAE